MTVYRNNDYVNTCVFVCVFDDSISMQSATAILYRLSPLGLMTEIKPGEFFIYRSLDKRPMKVAAARKIKATRKSAARTRVVKKRVLEKEEEMRTAEAKMEELKIAEVKTEETEIS